VTNNEYQLGRYYNVIYKTKTKLLKFVGCEHMGEDRSAISKKSHCLECSGKLQFNGYGPTCGYSNGKMFFKMLAEE
jgi:hypothetical protein